MKASSPALHHVHFLGESKEYRAARNTLLAEDGRPSALPPNAGRCQPAA